MPRIPIHSFQKKLTEQGPNTEQSAELAAQRGKSIQGFGSSVEGFGDKMRAASDLNQKIYSLKEFDREQTDLELELARDNDITPDKLDANNKQSYIARLEQAKLRAISSISDPKSRVAADLDFTKSVNNFRIKAETERYKQVGFRTKAEIQDLEQQIIEKEGQGLDASKLDEALIKAKSDADTIGIYNLEQAQERDAKWDKRRTKNILDSKQALAISSGSKEQADAFISSLKTMEVNGKKLSADMQADYAKSTLEALGNMQKRQQAEAKENMAENRVKTILSLSQGGELADHSDSDPLLQSTILKVKDFFSTAYNPKASPENQIPAVAGLTTVGELSKLDSYVDMIKGTFFRNDNEDLTNFMLNELQKKGDGFTEGIKLVAFTNLAELKMRANAPKTPEDLEAKKRFETIKEVVTALSLSPLVGTRAINDFVVRNYLSGKTGEEAKAEGKESLRQAAIDVNKNIAKLDGIPNKTQSGYESVEDLYNGANELDGEVYSGTNTDYSTQD